MTAEPKTTAAEREKVFLVGLQVGPMRRGEAEASLAELRRLAASTDGELVGEFLVNLREPSPGTFISSGFVDELQGMIEAAGAKTVILDDDVTPAQQRNLEKRWKTKVLNRSELILDIFAARAHTAEGKLQVELAQYSYRLPRVRGQGILMSRIGGGLGTRGPGEMELEVDRRVIKGRIHTLEQKIKLIKRRRGTERARRTRSGIPVIALVGYTNAGKSTLLNALTRSDVFVQDKLFATLDPTTRRGTLPSGIPVTFTDTVGFINRLPTQLAAAFRATLEEVRYADLLLHVVDVHSPDHQAETETTDKVLLDLGADDKPRIMVWNKIDRLAPDIEPLLYERVREPGAAVSAMTGAGLDRLLALIQKLIDESRKRMTLRFSYREYGPLNEVERGGTIHSLDHREDGIWVEVSLPEGLARKYEAFQSEPDPSEPATALPDPAVPDPV